MKKAVIVATTFLLLSAIFIASLQAETEAVEPLQTETEAVDQLQAETEAVEQLQAETEAVEQLQAETEAVEPLQTETEAINQLPESVDTLGRIDGSGTYFEITRSKYLNITLSSTAEIKLTLESIPRVVMISIESAVDAASTQITLGGLLPSTTYYKYEDDFHHLQVFTTDAAGTYVFIQDLTNSHLIFVKEKPSTYFLTDDEDTGGDCVKIGAWDAVNKTCTLAMDVDQTIEIDSDGITLDGTGFKITQSEGAYGIFLPKRKNVTIKNVTVENFSYGIYLAKSDGNMLVDNYVTSPYNYGIYLDGSKNNKLTGNSLYDNYQGIYIYNKSDDNVLAENTATDNSIGISLRNANNNVIMDNSVSSNTKSGIYLSLSSNNSLSGNMADANTDSGIYLSSTSNKNTLTGNTLSNNGNYGLAIYLSDENIIYNNNFIDNKYQTRISRSADNIFNMEAPAGGNYWNDYDQPEEGCIDEDDDGFCDMPYEVDGIVDELPWTIANGWLDSDGDGIPDDEDDCPDAAGPIDQNGCPYVDETHVSMRIVDYQRSGVCGLTKRGWTKRSCTVDLEAVDVKIFNREDEEFHKAYGRWPSRRRLDDIYEANDGLTGMCTTGKNGKCLVGEENQGKFLVIAKYVDADSSKTVYIGKFKDYWHGHGYGCWWDWNDNDPDDSTPPTKITKKLQITKVIQKNGHVNFLGKYMVVDYGP